MQSVADEPKVKVYKELEVLEIGGSKGHILETIEGDLLKLYKAFRWKMIPRCTGRYMCRDHSIVSHLRPNELVRKACIQLEEEEEDKQEARDLQIIGTKVETNRGDNKCDRSSFLHKKEWECQLSGREDTIIVFPLDDQNTTGIITYVKKAKSRESDITSHNSVQEHHSSKTSYVHTLNSRSGFRRKLEGVGICITKDGKFEVSDETK
mmetsp:Transcript_20157/g.28542  ORF Transcript_20157/g.28542 Transcript_20157/m.28542 type:complete len:208 (-) Transcript_20157:238-861(-)